MLLVGDTVIVDVTETGNVEDDFYCTQYNGKYGEVKAVLPRDVYAVQLDGEERICYFYNYELVKRARPAKKNKKDKKAGASRV